MADEFPSLDSSLEEDIRHARNLGENQVKAEKPDVIDFLPASSILVDEEQEANNSNTLTKIEPTSTVVQCRHSMQKFEDLKAELEKQEERHVREVKKIQSEIEELRRRVREYEETEPRSIGFNDSSTDSFVRTVEWTIKNFKSEEKLCPKGTPMWSPRFKLAGINEVRLEFLPNGREKSWNGFCSLFLWCPPGTKIRYQLWVGSFMKAPDEDTYDGEVGHGHSNFCPLEPEIDLKNDSVTVGCNIFEVMTTYNISERNLSLYAWPLQHWVKKEAEVLENRGVKSITWKVKKVGQALNLYQRGASICSPCFTAAGISDIQMEFYPNGCAATKKDGFCSLYVRCPEKVVLILTLIVGKVKKGPIKTTFDTASGKGLPDFCNLQEQINEDDTVDVGIELQSRPSASVLTLAS